MSVLLYYITDRHQFPGSASQQHDRLLAKIAEAARAGVGLIQLRERDVSARDLYNLATEALAAVRETRNAISATRSREPRLLINSRLDVALAAGVDGIHLRGDDIFASDARAIWVKAIANVVRAHSPASASRNTLIAVSCHAPAEVLSAEAHGADLVVYAPVFGKQGTTVQPIGLEGLRQACHRVTRDDKKVEAGFASGIPILALGGVTLANARDCIQAGAAGVAGIRLFQDHDVAEVVAALRSKS